MFLCLHLITQNSKPMSGENSILAISDSMTQPDGYDPYRHLFSAYIPSEKD